MEQNGALSLLIADDEASIRHGLSSVIDWEAQRIRVVGEAKDGDEAYELICRLHPDIVITDIKMPGCSGLDLIEKIHASCGSRTHFIILSGYDDFAFAQRAIRSRIACYLLKPVKTEDLVAEVARIRKEVIAQKASGELDKQVQLAARQGSGVLKEQFYSRLAEGEFHDEGDILRAAGAIRLTPIACPCAAVIFRFALPAERKAGLFSKADIRLFKTAFRNVLAELGTPRKQIEFFTDHGFEAGILVSPADGLREFLSLLAGTMEKISGVEISAGIGRPAQTLLDVPDSCSSAAEVSEYHMYESGTRLFDFRLLDSPPSGSPPLPPDIHRLAEAVVLDDVPAIRSGLERFFEKIFYIPMPPPRYVRGMCSYLMGEVSNRAAEFLSRGAPVSLPIAPGGLDSLETFREIHAAILQALILTAQNIQKYKRASLPPAVENAEKYIRGHALSRLLVKSVAEQVHLSESYFTALFKKSVGITVQDYIRNCKLEKAKELLIEKKMSVFEISDRLEYKDYRSFYRAFKRFTGRSPTEYQQDMTHPHERK